MEEEIVMLPAREFRIPRKVIIGSGASEQIGEESRKLGVKKGLIVTDKVMFKLGALDGIKNVYRLVAQEDSLAQIAIMKVKPD